MTPAVNVLKKHGISYKIHKYTHNQNHTSYGLEAAEKLDLDSARVFKTLVSKIDNHELVVAIVPVTGMLNLKLLAKVCGSKKSAMADKTEVEKTTGYILGGVSPLGQKKRLRTVIDSCAEDLKTIFVSGGRRGLEIELAPEDLATLTGGTFAPIAQAG